MTHSDDFVSIRGVRLPLNELVHPRLSDETYLSDLAQRMTQARPCVHFAEDGWFNPRLLELVWEEFDMAAEPLWKQVAQNRHEKTHRTPPGTPLGPASHLYFGIINSGWFVRVLSRVTGIEDLIPDPQLTSGGLHETRAGGHFAIHLDFDRHQRTGLQNRMVFITYLNKNWDPAWGGALELWDKSKSTCVTEVEPDFGRSLCLPHTEFSFHGHPHPLTSPDGTVRRSVAAYFYSNKYAAIDRTARVSSRFLAESRFERARRIGKLITPPVLWDIVAKLARR